MRGYPGQLNIKIEGGFGRNVRWHSIWCLGFRGYPEQLNVELEGGFGRNVRWHALPAVGALGVALDEGPLSYLHGDEGTLPARDHLRVRTCERMKDTLPARDHLRVCTCDTKSRGRHPNPRP